MNDVSVVGDDREKNNKNLAMIVYGLYGLALFTGGLTGIVAIIINYVKYDDVRGTWIESHFRWQVRTFWFSVLWGSLLMLIVFATLFIAMIIAWLPASVLAIWYIYRVVKGFLYLNDNKALYVA